MEESGDNGNFWEGKANGEKHRLSRRAADGGESGAQTPAASDGYASDTGPETAEGIGGKGATRGGSFSNHPKERKKGIPWTEEEHRLFLLGLCKLGKGDWRGISRSFVATRTPTQVASHAQKYFNRQNNLNKRKRRSSLFDINTDSLVDEATALTRSASTPTLPLAPEEIKPNNAGKPSHPPSRATNTPSAASSPKLSAVGAAPPLARLQNASLLDLNRSHSYPVVPVAGDNHHLPPSLSRPMSLPSLTPVNPAVRPSADAVLPPADVINSWRMPGVPDPWVGYAIGGPPWPPHPPHGGIAGHPGLAGRPDAVYAPLMMMDPAVRHRMGYEMMLRMGDDMRDRMRAGCRVAGYGSVDEADDGRDAAADADAGMLQGAEKKFKVVSEGSRDEGYSVHKQSLSAKPAAGITDINDKGPNMGPSKLKQGGVGDADGPEATTAAAAAAVAPTGGVPATRFPLPFSPPSAFYSATYHPFPDPSFMYMWPPYPPPPPPPPHLNLGCSWQPHVPTANPSSPGGSGRVLRPTAMLATAPLHVPPAAKECMQGTEAKQVAGAEGELQQEADGHVGRETPRFGIDLASRLGASKPSLVDGSSTDECRSVPFVKTPTTLQLFEVSRPSAFQLQSHPYRGRSQTSGGAPISVS